MTTPNFERLQDISADLRFWQRQNQGNPWLIGGENSFGYRAHAEKELLSLEFDLALEREQKIQLVAGAKAVELFSFTGNPYDFIEIKPAFDDQNLQPGDAMDLTRSYEGVTWDGQPGNKPALYMGRVLFAHSMAVADTLSAGGSLQLVAEDAEDTHWARVEREMNARAKTYTTSARKG